MVCVAFAMVARESHITVCYGILWYAARIVVYYGCLHPIGRGEDWALHCLIISPQVDSLRVCREEQ